MQINYPSSRASDQLSTSSSGGGTSGGGGGCAEQTSSSSESSSFQKCDSEDETKRDTTTIGMVNPYICKPKFRAFLL